MSLSNAISISHRDAPRLTKTEVLMVLDEAQWPLKSGEIGHVCGVVAESKRHWMHARGRRSSENSRFVIQTLVELRGDGWAVKLPHDYATNAARYFRCSSLIEARQMQLAACEALLERKPPGTSRNALLQVLKGLRRWADYTED